jgi:hypothetical protein
MPESGRAVADNASEGIAAWVRGRRVQAEVAENGEPAGSRVDRRELEAKLGVLNQDLLDLYREAVALFERPERNRAAMMMLSHAVREFANNLAHHLGLVEGMQFPASVDVSSPLGELVQMWDVESVSPDNPSSTAGGLGAVELAEGPDNSIRESTVRSIPERAYLAVEAVIVAHSRATDSARRRQAFIAVGNGATTQDPTAKLFAATFDFFMSYAHLDRAGKRRLPTEDELQQQFANFEAVVWARLGGFFDVVDALADIIDVANGREPQPRTDTADHALEAQ